MIWAWVWERWERVVAFFRRSKKKLRSRGVQEATAMFLQIIICASRQPCKMFDKMFYLSDR